MPNITLTWQPTFVSHGAAYAGAPHIIYLEWRRNDNNSLLPQSSSYLYVVENPEGSPVYAGKAKNARGRFDNRANALHELGLHPVDAVSDHIVRIASANPGSELAWAEKWLVRYLYCKDQQNTTKILQNINLNPVVSGAAWWANNHKPGKQEHSTACLSPGLPEPGCVQRQQLGRAGATVPVTHIPRPGDMPPDHSLGPIRVTRSQTIPDSRGSER